MKVLFCVRHNFNSSPGGAQIQIVKTKYHLEKIGVYCDLTTSPYGVDYNSYDILHLTDLTWVYDNLVYLREIKKQNFKGKKVLSTIYWPLDDYASNGSPLLQRIIFKVFGVNGFEFSKAIGKYIFQRDKIYLEGIKKSYLNTQRSIVNEMDMLLPNAELEMKALNERLKLNLKKYNVVYNAIDTEAFNKLIKNSNVKKDKNLITFVARIDPRKNPITLP